MRWYLIRLVALIWLACRLIKNRLQLVCLYVGLSYHLLMREFWIFLLWVKTGVVYSGEDR